MKHCHAALSRRFFVAFAVGLIMFFLPLTSFSQSTYCTANFKGDPTSGCAPLKVVFTDLSSDAAEWKWYFPGGVPSNASGKGPHTVTYNTPGAYDVELVIKCKLGEDSEKKIKYITVNDCDCQANFYGTPTALCAGEKVRFTDTSSGAASWQWTFPGGNPASATGKGPHDILYTTPGEYDVELKIQCKEGYDLEKKLKYIKVQDCTCEADFKGEPREGCAPLTVKFSDLSTGAIMWWWDFPGGTPASATGAGPHLVKYNAPGKYTVALSIECKSGKDYISKKEYVEVKGCSFDLGDAPNSYGTTLAENGARHIVNPEVYLGKMLDADSDGQPSPDAQGDDDNNQDDEDGVYLRTPLIIGDTALVELVASTNGMLKGWIDFNQDGNWNDPGETVIDQQVSSGMNVLHIPVPGDAKEGGAASRFRFSRETIMDWRGLLNDGEVEDYFFAVEREAIIPGEYGDAPEGVLAYPRSDVIGEFPTCRHVGPAGYIRHTALGSMYFGGAVDFETDGNAENCPVFTPDSYEQDEYTSPQGVMWGEDGGLLKPKSWVPYQSGDSLLAYSSWGGAYVIGQVCETVRWGRAIDISYHATHATSDGYVNVLFDWDHNGRWGGGLFCHDGSVAVEHAVVNVRVPAGSAGNLSTLMLPDLKIGPMSGYIWVRFTISENPAPAFWDGSGRFINGETEDYLLYVFPAGEYFDGGDAPEDQLAYPATGQIGYFPTCKHSGASGHVEHAVVDRICLGYEPDLETNGNSGNCPTVRADEFNRDVDNGLENVKNYGLAYDGIADYRILERPPYFEENQSLGRICQMADWGPGINAKYTNNSGEIAYINVLIDWNQDGQWGGSSECGDGHSAPEHCLVNHPVARPWGAISSESPPSFRIGPNPGYVWARFTISDIPVELPWDGSGVFAEGETEDYLLHVQGNLGLMDYGDAPSRYGTGAGGQGAYHFIEPNICLGLLVDAESSPEPSEDAQSDDKSGQDDEDGIIWKEEVTIGDTILVEAMTSAAGILKGWIDFNQDGDWEDEGERVAEVQAVPGTQAVRIIVPQDAKPGPTYARWRFSTEAIPRPNDPGGIGEIEDYLVVVAERIKLPFEFGDAPEGAIAYPDLDVSGNFPTCKYSGAAGFVQHGAMGNMFLGYHVDYELDGNGGSCPTFCGEFDKDEGLNEIRDGVYIYEDIGLTTPICYTVGGDGCDYYHPNSVFRTRGVLGENCESIIWGDNIDLVYHVKAEAGAYLNILIDWNQDGSWGGSISCPDGGSVNEWVLQNFHIPKGLGDTGFGRLSDLTPPTFRIGPNAGYVWMRATITPERIPGSFNGSGSFTDGESEDYLLCVSLNDFADYGDAPEGALAYPDTGTMGSFPTCRYDGSPGYLRHDPPSYRYLGSMIDYERNGNAGFCSSFGMHYDADESFYDSRIYSEMSDAGLRLLLPYRISGMAGAEFVTPYSPPEGSGLATSLGHACGTAVWGEDLDLYYRILERSPNDYAYINVLFDWDMNGQWGGSSTCSESGGPADEWVLQNFRVTGWGARMLSGATPPSFRIGPNKGYVWARFTITQNALPDSWDGSGVFEDGETEDYLIHVSDRIMLFDYGDISSWFDANQPSGYARHAILPGFHLGATVDPDGKEMPDDHALGDDHDGTDDEDGITWRGPYTSENAPGLRYEIEIVSSGEGFINAWLDVTGDSTWATPCDHILKDLMVTQGKNIFTVTLPDCTMIGPSFARVRLSQTSGLRYFDDDSGEVYVGEVEDYEFYLGATDNGYDFGDVVDPTFATLMTSNGARHILVTGILLGERIDSDLDGQPDGDANGDDMDGIDDDDGVTVVTPIISKSPVTFKVHASTRGYLNTWIDWNGDGDWFDANEHPFADIAIIAGDNLLTCTVPDGALSEKMFARFRFCTFKGIPEQGMAPDGEVEDYRLYLTVTGLETDAENRIPETYALLQNYPNPFNPQTTIEFHLPQPGEVRLSLYDIQGREVRRLLQGNVAAGQHTMIWNGRDTSGKLVPSGVYFYRLTVKDGGVFVKKMLLLK